jgi:hypothetical protein
MRRIPCSFATELSRSPNGSHLSQRIGIIIEEKHPDDLDTMAVLFQLRQDDLAQFVTDSMTSCAKNEGYFH